MQTIQWEGRKPRILGRGVPHCLKELDVYSLNILVGCPFECDYCKYQARGFTPPNVSRAYREAPTQLADELRMFKRKSRTLRMVLFNTACDVFVGDHNLEALARECIRVLQNHKIYFSLATKGLPSTETLELLAQAPHDCHLLWTVAATDDAFSEAFEPRVPSTTDRMERIAEATALGLTVRGRIEPLIPMENDDARQVEALLRRFKRAGVTEIVAGYVQMTPELVVRVGERLPRGRRNMLLHWFVDNRGQTRGFIDPNYRKRRYEEFKKLAEGLGMHLVVCACRNTDLFAGRCHSVPRSNSLAKTLLL